MILISNYRTLAISDIHGCYDELVELLKLTHYNPEEDQLILLGDYIDRGPKSRQTVAYIMKLVEEGAIAIRGNHDQMFLDFIDSNDPIKSERYLRNGGLSTLKTYVGYDRFQNGVTEENLYAAKQLIREKEIAHVAFLSNLPFYFQTEKHLFIHAGIDPSLADWKEMSDHDKIWIRHEFLGYDHNYDFTVVHGHSPTSYIRGNNDNSVLFGNKKIGIDGACAYGGRLNCLIITGNEYTTAHINKGDK